MTTLTLSAAKGLARWAKRPFAEFTLSEANVLRVTIQGCTPSQCIQVTFTTRFMPT